MFEKMRKELYDFYLTGDAERSKSFADLCFDIMDARYEEGMTVTAQKLLQYDVISEQFDPVIFRHNPFFYETGVLTSVSDGAFKAKGLGFYQANAWTYLRNEHLFIDQDPELYRLTQIQKKELLYLICGPYNDVNQHFNFNCRPFLSIGAKGIYEAAKAELAAAKNDSEKEFLEAVCHGMTVLRSMAEKFASKAEQILLTEKNAECRKNLIAIASCARKIPWEAPQTFYEALATLAFLRTAIGSLEGAGPNTFGRLDKDLISFYRADIKSGRLTATEAYELICQFLLIWDCHYDHDMPMEGYADHELENTYTLGGCDDNGEPLCNELTLAFLRATREERIIFPKIKCRYSKKSPDAYLEELCRAIVAGTTTVLIQNDDATVPAILRSGRPLEEARDYYVAGCWGMGTNQEKFDHGSYLNLLKPFEFSIHGLREKAKLVEIDFEMIEGDEDFEELYRKTLRNCELVLDAKLDKTRRGGQIFSKVSVFPIFSATLEDCLKKHADFTRGGARYHDDYQLLFGLPNIVDSLMAIKTLVFDEKKYTLFDYLTAVRANWEGYEEMRLAATRCHGWGDANEDSCALANRLNNDLFAIFQKKVGTYGGKVHMGHLTYTEIRFWGEATLATPDGRKNGEYFAQGLTPSRLKRIPCVNDVINSLACLDPSTMAGNSVVNIILPPKIPLDRCVAFLRACAGTAMQALQLNCTSREELLDAQKHPEKYPDLIVRVTGFSAKFTSLSKEWQDEVLSRNFYE
jgi:formate C-acetyltransferase